MESTPRKLQNQLVAVPPGPLQSKCSPRCLIRGTRNTRVNDSQRPGLSLSEMACNSPLFPRGLPSRAMVTHSSGTRDRPCYSTISSVNRRFCFTAAAPTMVRSERAVRPCRPITLPKSLGATRSSSTWPPSSSAAVTETCSVHPPEPARYFRPARLRPELPLLRCRRPAQPPDSSSPGAATVSEICAPFALPIIDALMLQNHLRGCVGRAIVA